MIAILHSGQQADRQRVMEEYMKKALAEGRGVYCNFPVKSPELKGKVKVLGPTRMYGDTPYMNADICVDKAEEWLSRRRHASKQNALMCSFLQTARKRNNGIVLCTESADRIDRRALWTVTKNWECHEEFFIETDALTLRKKRITLLPERTPQ